MGALIRIHNLTHTYPGHPPQTALRDITLEIEAGEYVAIVGHNGSGKSTLARHLNALLLPTTGEVWIDNLRTDDPVNTIAIRRQVAMVFQNPDNQIVGTVVEEDVAFGPENLGLPADEVRARVEWALETVGLTKLRHSPPHLLSAGQRQLVAIAGALAMRPRILVLDEATSLLDPQSRETILALLRRLHREGITILTITHDMEEAAEADRILVMDHGHIALQGPPQQIFRQTETLRTLQLDIPPTVELAQRLTAHFPDLPPTPLTVEELAEALLPYLRAPAHNRPTPPPVPNHPSHPPFFQARDLHHTYLQGTPLATTALRGVTLSIPRGTIVGLTGRAGAGKSTLVQHFNALLRPTEQNRMWVDNQDTSARDLDLRALRRKVGLVFQTPEQQIFAPRVDEEIAFGLRQLGLPAEEVERRVERALETVGLPPTQFRHRSPFALSGGERRRVALASILAMEPQALILDETTAGLDPRGRKTLLQQLAQWHTEHNLTIVLVSPRVDELITMDQIFVLDTGRVALGGPPATVLTETATLRDLGLTPPTMIRLWTHLQRHGVVDGFTPLTLEAAEAYLCRLGTYSGM